MVPVSSSLVPKPRLTALSADPQASREETKVCPRPRWQQPAHHSPEAVQVVNEGLCELFHLLGSAAGDKLLAIPRHQATTTEPPSSRQSTYCLHVFLIANGPQPRHLSFGRSPSHVLRPPPPAASRRPSEAISCLKLCRQRKSRGATESFGRETNNDSHSSVTLLTKGGNRGFMYR